MNEANNNNMCQTCGKSCGCGHHKVGAIAVLLIGIAFLLGAFGVLSDHAVAIIWPILLIIAAAGKLCRCCSRAY